MGKIEKSTEKVKEKARLGALLVLISTFTWSSSGIFVSYLQKNYGMTPMGISFWRDLLASAIIFLVIAFVRPISFKNIRVYARMLIGFGFVTALFNYTWSVSIKMNGAAVAAVLTYSSPVFTAILSHYIFKEKNNVRRKLAIIIGFLGAFLVSGATDLNVWKVNFWGIIIGVAAGFLYSVYSIIGEYAAKKGVHPLESLFGSFFFASIFLFILNLSSQQAFMSFKSYPMAWAFLLILVFFPTLSGYGLYMFSLGMIPASTANLISSMEPFFTILWAYLFLNEKFTGIQFFGGILILIAVFLIQFNGKNKMSSDDSSAEGTKTADL